MLRAVLLVVGLAACGFTSSIGGDDVQGDLRTVTDGDLAGTAKDGVLADGNVTPDGFVLGGLHARGFQSQLVDTGEDMTKILADAAAATELGASYAQVPIDWGGSGRPKGLGLVNDGNFTVIYDGEILLPKGEVRFEASVDDRGVIEVMGQQITNTGMATFVVEEAGWYPIRAALSQASGTKRMVMTIVQEQVRTVVDASRLRARVTNSPGLVGFVFDNEHFESPHGQIARPTVAETFATIPSYDLTTSFDHFSLRFAGQLRIDIAGTYTFDAAIAIDDSARIWIDGTPIAHTRWPGLTDVATGTVALTAGWHTIVVDYMDEIGLANIEVHMMGPDAPTGGTIDPMHLRPVVVHGNTHTSEPAAQKDIGDNTSTLVPLVLPGAPDELIDAVDYGFQIDNQTMTTLEVTLFDCSTAGRMLTTGLLPGVFAYAADKNCAGKVTNPLVDWAVRLFDNTVGTVPFAGPGVVRDFWISALYRGGPKMPFAPVFSYVSTPQPTPGAVRIEAVRALGALDGTTIELAVRAADDPAALDAQAFEVVREDVKIEARGDFVQYRVTISSNGWISPVLDMVEIDYIAQ